MAFNGDNMTPVGGNARSGREDNQSGKNAPMSWAYQSDTDALAAVLAVGYFDTFADFLTAGQYIYISVEDGKFFLTVGSVDRLLKMVFIDAEVFRPGQQTASIKEILHIDHPVNSLNVLNQPLAVLGDFETITSVVNTDRPTYNVVFNGSRFGFDVFNFTNPETLTIGGTSIDVVTGVVTEFDNEVLTLISLGLFISDKSWLEVTDLQFSQSPADLFGDVLSVKTFRNRGEKYAITGYQGKITSIGDGTPPPPNFDARLVFIAIRHSSGKLFTETILEDIAFINNGGSSQIIDHKRTGPSSRSFNYALSNPFIGGIPYDWTQDDFLEEQGALVELDPSIGEGLLIELVNNVQDAGSASVDMLNLTLFVKPS